MTRWLGFGTIVALGLALLIAQVIGTDAVPTDPIIVGVAFGIYSYFGGLIIARRDGHLTGWLLTLSGLVIVFADGFGRLPFVGPDLDSWVQSWVWTAEFAVFAAMALTFPSGKPPGGAGMAARLGRIALYALPVLVATSALTRTLGGPEAASGQLNPIGLLPAFLSYPSLLAVVAILISGTISLVVKRKHASGTERAQLTWVVFAMSIFVTLVGATFVYIFGATALTGIDPGDDAWAPVFIMVILFPLSFAIAIIRYRLFDIDRIVSRTVTYAIVAALLAVAFFAVVTLLGTLIPVDDSSWQVAASTLVVAALFNPARRRVHSFVDRRFNRSNYDSQRVAADLSDQIRDEIDPLLIGDAWIQAVSSAVQPSVITLWLKDQNVGARK